MISKNTLKQAAILFFTSVFGGLANYFYNIYVGRMLGPSDYSIVVSLFSIIGIISMPISTVQTVVIKYTADFTARKQFKKLGSFVSVLSEKVLVVSLIVFVLFAVASTSIANYLRINSVIPVILLGAVLIPMAFLTVYRGVLQGLQRFFSFSLNGTIEALLKLFFGVLLVYLLVDKGFGVSGAVFSLTLAGFISIVILRFQLKDFRADKNNKSNVSGFKISDLYGYGGAVFLHLLCFTIVTNVNVILIRHYFPSEEAGFYAASEVIGKIVLFLSGVVPVILLPKSATLHAQKSDTKKMFIKSVLLVSALGLVFTVFNFVFSGTVMSLFFGAKFIESAKYLGPLSIAMSFYSLYLITATYELSISRFKFLYPTIILTILQVLLILQFHSNISEIIYIIIGCSSALFLINLIISLKNKDKNRS